MTQDEPERKEMTKPIPVNLPFERVPTSATDDGQSPERDKVEVDTGRNVRVESRYDELREIGKHGHYETMFQVVREEVERAISSSEKRAAEAEAAHVNEINNHTETLTQIMAIESERDEARSSLARVVEAGEAYLGWADDTICDDPELKVLRANLRSALHRSQGE